MPSRRKQYRKKRSFRRRGSYRTKRTYKKKKYSRRTRYFNRKPEQKSVEFYGDYPWTQQNTNQFDITSNGRFIELQDMIQPGVTSQSRIGDRIVITGLTVRGRLVQAHASAANNIAPVLNDNYNDVALALLTSDVLEGSDPNQYGVNGEAFNSWWPQQGVRIMHPFDKRSLEAQCVRCLFHKRYHLDGRSNVAYGAALAGTGFWNFTSDPAYVNVNIHKKLNIPVQWQPSLLRCMKNRIAFCMLSDSSTLPHPHFDSNTFYMRVTYYDV